MGALTFLLLVQLGATLTGEVPKFRFGHVAAIDIDRGEK
jgi:hypothetical protein